LLLTEPSVDFAKSKLHVAQQGIADSIAGQAAKFSMDLKPKEWPSFMDNVSLPAQSLDKLTVKEGKKTHVYESKKILGQLFQLVS
jgi:hypothetical protein